MGIDDIQIGWHDLDTQQVLAFLTPCFQAYVGWKTLFSFFTMYDFLTHGEHTDTSGIRAN